MSKVRKSEVVMTRLLTRACNELGPGRVAAEVVGGMVALGVVGAVLWAAGVVL